MVLRGEKISRRFSRGGKDFFAVRETEISLEGGRLVTLEGRSGSGKTTLLNLLSGILAPSSGRVLIDETSLYEMEDGKLSRFRNEHFGIIPQGQSAVSTLTVLENVMLPGTIYGLDEDLKTKAMRLLERMEIADLANSMPKVLSGGEMRRMAIARALINDPGVIFADEPTSDLDDRNTETVFRILKEIAGSGKAVFTVTHEKCAGQFADERYRMDSGALGRL